ncbi:MAG: tripartite tricarboxylate transporter substrate-binding protein [Vicinamibacterales bacterium]
MFRWLTSQGLSRSGSRLEGHQRRALGWSSLRALCGALAALALTACGQPSSTVPRGQSAATDFYRGKTVSIVVGSGAGGGFDTTARLVARHIGKHIPGAPTVIVVNMPGGGGLVAANHVFSAAPKDGTVIGLFHEAQMMNQLTGGEGVNFDLRQFNWLGSSYDDPNVCIVRTDAGVTSFKEMIGSARIIAVGGTGPGSNTYDAPRVLAAATGASLKAVAGYPTTNDVRIGVERGEIQGMCLGWESVKSASSQWLKDGYAKVIVQNGVTRHGDLPDVPLAIEFAKDDERRMLLRLVDAPGAMAKPFTLPPGVDPARVEIIRTALTASYHDAALLDEARAMNLEFQSKTARQIHEILDEVLATPPAVAARYREIIQP